MKFLPFNRSLNKRNSSLGIKYLSDHVPNLPKNPGNDYSFEDLIILGEYPKILPIYKTLFQNVVYGTQIQESTNMNFLNLVLKFSQGRIHSVYKDEEDKKFIILRPSETFCYFDFDVNSFYVDIILKILESSDSKEFFNYFLSLSEQRKEMKMAKNPIQNVLKIIILSITGNLNFPNSYVYNPQIYFSMTVNGQLLIAETLMELEPLFNQLIFANTDGFAIAFEKSKKSQVFETISKIEKDYGYNFDTRMEISKGFLFHVNKYVIQYAEETSYEIKGFNDQNETLLSSFLIFCLESNFYDFEKHYFTKNCRIFRRSQKS